MSQSFISIRERFETITSQNETVTSGKFQSTTTSRSYVQAANLSIRIPSPGAIAFPEKTPPPISVIRRVSPIATKNRDERSEKVNSFSELIKEQSGNLRTPPKVPQKPIKLLSGNPTIKEKKLLSNVVVLPTTPTKPSQSEKFRVQNKERSNSPSVKVHHQSDHQRNLSVNRLRQRFEQAHVEVPVASNQQVTHRSDNTTRVQTQQNGVSQLHENHYENLSYRGLWMPEVSPNSMQQTSFPKHFSPAIENLYDDPIYQRMPTLETSPTCSHNFDNEELYANLPNNLGMLESTTNNLLPLPPKKLVYEHLANHERQMFQSSTLPRHFKSVSFEKTADKKLLIANALTETSRLSYDSDFDDDYEEFGEITTTQVQSDEDILGKHFALNNAHDRKLSALLLAPRQRFSYAAPQNRPELKPSMSFSQKSHERALIRNKDTPDDSEKYDKKLQNIAGELISTEKVYVENLTRDFNKFNKMLTRKDIPRGLKDKHEMLFGNIEQIILFHRDTVLPMFEKNQKDLNSLFDQFSVLLDDNRFYEYVIFTTNNKNSLKIVEEFQPYFQHFQTQINDPLGIQNFLLLPVQRLPRYELFLKDFKKALFEACSHSSKYSTQKSQVKALCDLEKKMKNLLSLINEANVVCDIIGWANLNLFNRENRFRKVLDDLFVYDYDLQQGYGSKVFIFDKFMIYTEVKGDYLIYRGCYDPSKGIDLIAEQKAFKMAHRRVQVCNFHSETATHNQYCLSYIEDMIHSNRIEVYNQRGLSSNTSSGNMSTLHEEDEF